MAFSVLDPICIIDTDWKMKRYKLILKPKHLFNSEIVNGIVQQREAVVVGIFISLIFVAKKKKKKGL